MGSRYTSGLKPTLSYIRAFLRFVTEQSISNIDLVKAVPKSVSPKRAVYSGFSAEEVEKMLIEVDVSTPQGKRDYAILQLGIKTGIRAIDVVKLKRQDIDWRNNAINIVQSKTNQPIGIPLSTDVGNAIADYLLNGRPSCGSLNIFIRSYFPARPLSSAACGNIVRKYFHKAGLKNTQNRPIGYHTLRRTFGAHLLKAGTSVDMIGELLGVSDINSVQPYLAADEDGLKSCAISLIPLTLAKGGMA
jgi:site-specific recombinase XerD